MCLPVPCADPKTVPFALPEKGNLEVREREQLVNVKWKIKCFHKWK